MLRVLDLTETRSARYGIATGCHGCVFKQTCGGLENSRPLLDCFEQYCCNNKINCDEVCPRNDNFAYRLAEIRGFKMDDLSELHQSRIELPKYMPMIHHGSRRHGRLNVSFAVISLFDLFVQKGDRLVTKFSSAEAIRDHFRLSHQTQLVLRGTDKDKFLERYWKYHQVNELAECVSKLGVSFVIGLNFSSFLDVPRTDVMFNRKRQLLCLSELSDEGVSVAPHLSVTMPADWEFWTNYLRSNPQIRHVAFNFQTGYKNKLHGKSALRMLRKVRDGVGRELIPILIGGTQFTKYCSTLFENFSITDSVPFAKTMRRSSMKTADGTRKWIAGYSLFGQSLCDLMQENVESYSAWINLQLKQPN